MEEELPVYGEAPKYPVESVDNALRLLAILVTRSRLRVKDGAQALGVSDGTAHRLLAMLLYRGFVSQDVLTKMYLPGPTLLSLGARARGAFDLRAAARPFLERLKAGLDETIQLATLHNSQVHFVDSVESGKGLRVGSRAGTLRPAHCTSVGKALLALLDEQELYRIYPDEKLPTPTRASIGTRKKLLAELEVVRSRGYAVNVGELEDGIGSVGVAIRDAHGRGVSIGAGAPLSRIPEGRLHEMAASVQEIAAELEELLRSVEASDETGS